jgi:hypothetical protein
MAAVERRPSPPATAMFDLAFAEPPAALRRDRGRLDRKGRER